MTLTNVKLILAREIRDQLRDRRTLFMMFVLPLLLYPLLGMSFFQISQFMREKPVSVWVVGARDLAGLEPRLFENQQFAQELFTDPNRARLLELHFAPAEPEEPGTPMPDQWAAAWRDVQAGVYDAALYFPPDFAEKLARVRQEAAAQKVRTALPEAEIIFTTANEKSQVARDRLSNVFDRWFERLGETNLAALKVPVTAVRPFKLDKSDVAGKTAFRGAALWSKLLPVMLLVWALTGAFYPAVDLCAGEKERGTLETLLSSPAERSEIVVGKLATIMLFSMATAVLNLVSVGCTGWIVFARQPGFAMPTAMSVVWLAVALVPVSALFSALCLALAAFARSTKEGQYYLMPLLLVTMPLVVLPMTPGIELSVGNSLIPITGVVLVLRTALEGNYLQALQFLPLVVGVTLTGALLAIRWAVDQFNSETVLFREGERLDLRLWLRHLTRDRQPTPGVAAAVSCGMLILLVQFFMNSTVRPSADFAGLAKMALVTQLVVVATPALLMTATLTSSVRQTLLLRRPPWMTIPAALLLAVFLHPVVNTLQVTVSHLYPIGDEVKAALETVEKLLRETPFWQKVIVLAVVPGICEELAFRGFILSGFRHLGHRGRAIVYAAVFFGLTHTVLQQSLIACLVGVVIGYLAVQSGSILPGMLFHTLHNTLALGAATIIPKLLARWPALESLISSGTDGGYVYHRLVVAAGGLASLWLLFWFGRLPWAKSPEEQLQEAIERAGEDEED